MQDNPFAKIIRGELEADKVYEDERCVAFRDIQVVAPTHILIIPKDHIAKLADADESHQELLGHLLLTASKIAKKEDLQGYRVVINNDRAGGQTVFHLHIHLIGGRALVWPPG